MCSPFSHLSIDVSTAHVDTIYFCTNPTDRRLSKMIGRSVENEIESGLTLRLAHYLAEVQRTFMLTYVLFMLVIQCHFPQCADRLGISVQA